MKQCLSWLVVSICFLCLVSTSSAEVVKVWGSTTCQKRFLEPGAAALEKATGVKVKVLGVGTGKGMLALLGDKTSVAASSSPLESSIKSAIKAAKKNGKPEPTIPDNIMFHEIAKDVIVPIAHKDNPVNSLTFEQLSDLNTGKITNWKDVGGPDVSVKVITSHAGSATRSVFQNKVMKKADYAAEKIEVKSTRLEINEVSKNKGGIGAVSEGFYMQNPDNAKIIKADPIERPLALITIGEPTPEVQKIIDFFRGDGKKFFE